MNRIEKVISYAWIAVFIILLCHAVVVVVHAQEPVAQPSDDQLRLYIANATIELQRRQIDTLSKENAELKKQLAALKPAEKTLPNGN